MLHSFLSFGCPEDVAPFITEEKLSFTLSRWLQSWLGGVWIRRALKDHIKVNVFQMTVLLFPPLLGAAMSPVTLDIQVKSLVFSFCVLALVVILQSTVFLIRRNSYFPKRLVRKSIDDTDTHVNYKLFSTPVLEMLIPTKSLVEEGFDIALTLALTSMSMQLLSVHEMSDYGAAYDHCIAIENILGWTVFAICQYPLSARPPIEVNEWRIGAPVTIDISQRAIYFVILSGIDWGLKCASQNISARILVRYCIYSLPFLINFGVLPPISALFEYIIEQCLITGFGYNLKEDRGLLIFFLVVYSIVTLVLVYISFSSVETTICPAIAAVCGRWISSPIIRQLKKYIGKYCSTSIVMPFDCKMLPITDIEKATDTDTTSWQILLYNPAFQSFMQYCGVAAIAAVVGTISQKLSTSQFQLLQREMIAIVLVIWIGVQVRLRIELTGTCFNKYVTLNTTILHKVATALDWSLRLALWILISIYFSADSTSLFGTLTANKIWKNIALLHVWAISQHNPYQAFPTIWPASVLAMYTNLSFASSIFITAFAQTRLQHLMELMHFASVIISSIIVSPKQRYPWWVLATLCGLPISLISLVFSTIFLSPIYPFCGSTIFLAAFPRPRRFWYAYEECHDSQDATYYEHMFEALTQDLHKMLSTSTLLHQRSLCSSRDIYIIRVDSYLAFLEILELGTTFCVVRFRGLELQETTSCHHLEASKLDEAIHKVFGESSEENSDDEDDAPEVGAHPLRLNIFTPLIRAPIRMYSMSTAVLTGFIDDPGCLQVISQAFWMTLITELNRVAHGSVPDIWLSSPVSVSSLDFVLKDFPSHYWDYLQSKNKKQHTKADLRSAQPLPRITTEDVNQQPRRSSLRLAATTFLKMVMHLKPTRSSMTTPAPVPQTTAALEIVRTDTPSQKTLFQNSSQAYGLQEEATDAVNYEALAKQRPTLLQGKKSFSWGDIDGHVPEITKSTKTLTRPSFLKERWNKVSDFHNLAASCYAIVQTLGYGPHDCIGANHIYQCFHGNFPRSLENDWLKANTTLYDVVVRAYRLAVKLGFDKFAEGEIDIYDSPEEIEALIAQYQNKWYIGPKNSLVWKRHIKTSRPYLFALSKNNQGDYISNIYTLCTQDATIVSINRAACEGIWAGLGIELLYMTNDDDERFSIQSNPQLLRNLLVQSADPPLGYPVFCTGAVMVKL
ncbi:pecanex 4 [Thraustotheca clavata]|uniref:Pecanex 4 n=1 Tax=Thraustotheca clavata TaxID=74557 RepID=A0A1V9Y6E9_9STRA|nr:pecanex 4 [Thraustotheca clavata]